MAWQTKYLLESTMDKKHASDGEFVIPADVVSHLGNGNSEAGAKELYAMMSRTVNRALVTQNRVKKLTQKATGIGEKYVKWGNGNTNRRSE